MSGGHRIERPEDLERASMGRVQCLLVIQVFEDRVGGKFFEAVGCIVESQKPVSDAVSANLEAIIANRRRSSKINPPPPAMAV